MRVCAGVVLFVVWGFSTIGVAADFPYAVAWDLESESGFSAPNALCDVASGRVNAFVVCERDKGVVCVSLEGQVLWRYPMTPPVTAAPAVADVDGDGVEDIVAADSVGNLVALKADGTLLWSAIVPGGVVAESCPAIARNGSEVQIFVGDTSGTLSCFGAAGDLRWQFTGDGSQMGPVLVADVYDAPGSEIVVTSHDGHIYMLDARGSWLWDVYAPNDLFPNSTPILADVEGDGQPELYVGGGLHHFYRIDLKTHAVVLAKNIYLHINSAIVATDLEGDGKDEVIFGNKGGAVFCYGEEGVRWTYEPKRGSLYAAPMIVNLDADPALEILLLGATGTLNVLKADGTLLGSELTPFNVMISPLAGDFDGDGLLELLVTTYKSGVTAWIDMPVAFEATPRNRTVFAGNRARTGLPQPDKTYALLPAPAPSEMAGKGSVTPYRETRLLTGTNAWRFDVANPAEERLVLIVELRYPSGARHVFAKHIHGAKERVKCTFGVPEPGSYEATWTLMAADTLGVLQRESLALDFNGLDSDEQYLAQEVFPEIEAIAAEWQAANPKVVEVMRRKLLALKGMIKEIGQASTPLDTSAVEFVRHEALRLRDLARAGKRLAPIGSFFAWSFNPWAYFDAHETVPGPENQTESLSTDLCIGEYDSMAINITSLAGRTLDVRVHADPLRKANGAEDNVAPLPFCPDRLVFRHAVTVPNVRRERVADALPELDAGNLLRIASLETEQLWITVHAKDLPPGDYTTMVRLDSVEPDATGMAIPLSIHVHDVALPRPRPLRFCVWSSDGADPLSPRYPEVLRDLVDHNVTVHFGTAPDAVCDARGRLVGRLDFSIHDETVKRLSPHGFLLFMSPQGHLTGQPFLSDPWKEAFVVYLRQWVKHIKKLGLDYSDWALYPYDEPSSPYTETTLNLVEVAKLVRAADPNILIYTDPTSGTTMKTVEMFTGLIDIWCPSAELLERLADEMIPVAKRVAKEVWFYDAAGCAQTLSCLGIYRWRFWHAWNNEFTGVGWWVYGSHAADFWDGPNPTGDFFSSVYTGRDGPVTSKRWEVAREGVEDYELLYLLRDAIAQAGERGVAPEKIAQAREVLDAIPAKTEDVLYKVGRRIELTPDSVPAYEAATQALKDARARIIQTYLDIR